MTTLTTRKNASVRRPVLLAPRLTACALLAALTACGPSGPAAPTIAADAPSTSTDLTPARGFEHQYRGEWGSRYQDWFDARASPIGRINWDDYRESREAMRLAALLGDTDDGPRYAGHGHGGGGGGPGGGLPDDIKGNQNGHKWVELGPRNLDVFTTNGQGLPPVSGRINGLAYDPNDTDTIYAASACGGVWKTTDAGVHWSPRSDAWDELYTTAVAVGSDGVVYVGTGDYPGGLGSGIGLMISKDGGATWTTTTTYMENRRISDIVVDPDEPNRVTVATGSVFSNISSKVYQSIDHGEHFSIVINEDAEWSDLSIGAPGTGGIPTYYAVGRTGFNEFRRSFDRGETWVQLPAPTLGPDDELGIAASKVFADTVYMLTPGNPDRKVWKSDEFGLGWASITGNLDLSDWGQSFYNYGIETFRRETTILRDAVLVANIDAFVGDGSGIWTSMKSGYGANREIHVDNHCFAVNPDDQNEVLVGNDGGVSRYTFNPFTLDGSATSLSRRLGCVLANRVDMHPTNVNFLMGGTQDNGTPLCTGNLGQWYNIVGGDTGHVAINQTFPQIQYACSPFLGRDGAGDVHIDRTDDFWNVGSGSELITNVGGDNLRHGAPVAIDPIMTNYFYFASNYLYRYDELNGTWENRVGGQKLSEDGHVRTFHIPWSNNLRIYSGAKEGEVWTTDDFGATWTRIDDGPDDAHSLPELSVSGISADPYDTKRVLVTFESSWTTNFSNGIWECKDVNANPPVWNLVTGTGLIGQGRLPKVPINAVARHPGAPKTHWFVATDYGVWGTRNAGKTWFDMTRPLGLPNVMVTDIKAMPKTKTLVVSTFGRGFWRLKLDDVVGGVIQAP